MADLATVRQWEVEQKSICRIRNPPILGGETAFVVVIVVFSAVKEEEK